MTLFFFWGGGWVPNRTSRQKPRLTQLWSKYGVKVLIIIVLFPVFLFPEVTIIFF